MLVENFKPGTLARWGMDYERDLRERFPKLIHCAVSGFGPDGPLGGLPGYDAAIQAMTGLMSVNGEARRARHARRLAGRRHGHRPERARRHSARARRAREAAAVASRSISRCTTAACRCCIRICRTISARAARRSAAATRIPTSRRTTAIAPRPRRSFWRWATTGSSRNCARISARPNSPTIRVTSTTAAAARIASR